MSLLKAQTARGNPLAAPLGSNLVSLMVRARCRRQLLMENALYSVHPPSARAAARNNGMRAGNRNYVNSTSWYVLETTAHQHWIRHTDTTHPHGYTYIQLWKPE